MDETAYPNRLVRVAALTSTDPQRHLTWHLRVEALLPYLRTRGVVVDCHRIPRDRRATRALFETLGDHDLVWLHRHIFWPSDIRHLCRAVGRIVLDIDDPVGLSSSKPLQFSLPRCLRFRATAGRCSAVFAASDGLVRLARAHNDRVFFIPLCADPDRYLMTARPRRPGEHLRLLWLGNRSTFKYLEQVRPCLEAIGRRCSGVELVVVGHSRLELKGLPVRNVTWSAEAEQDELARAHVGLVPMAKDRWTMAKAALKPLQYLASGLPFVGNRVGVNLRLADDGRNGLLADTPAEWVEAIRVLEADEALRLGMAAHGVEYIRQHHSPDVLADQVAAAFRTLLPGDRVAQAA